MLRRIGFKIETHGSAIACEPLSGAGGAGASPPHTCRSQTALRVDRARQGHTRPSAIAPDCYKRGRTHTKRKRSIAPFQNDSLC
jgi:hypothetical protein